MTLGKIADTVPFVWLNHLDTYTNKKQLI